jgi:2-C-methyl-D-erythritol 2,4-cyclodiphosphate synthase
VDCPPLEGNSDADVVLHAITNAVSGVTSVPVLGKIADEMCLVQGMKDSREYLKKALEYLKEDETVDHVSISIECSRPKISGKVEEMKASIAEIMRIDMDSVAITATSGEGLTDFGRGLGIHAFCIVTVS